MESKSKEKVVRAYSRRFHNLYLFVTERCQLRCGHCYMGDRLERGRVMSYQQASRIISYFHRLGAEYLTFVGGEPTLHPDLPAMIDHALTVGYKKVMLDTNGLLPDRVITNISPQKLYYLRVSLDGATSETHDKVRGQGTFLKAVEAIRKFVSAGYDVRITTTVFQFTVHEAPLMLALADELGVNLVNFHTFSEEGYGAMNPDWSLSPTDWIKFYGLLETVKHKYKTSVRYPPTWAYADKLQEFINQGYQGCLGCSLDRVSVFPDGRCYICSLMFDTAMNFANLTEQGLVLNKGQNEFEMFLSAQLKAPAPWETGCPAERILEVNGKKQAPNEMVSICRLWKAEA